MGDESGNQKQLTVTKARKTRRRGERQKKLFFVIFVSSWQSFFDSLLEM